MHSRCDYVWMHLHVVGVIVCGYICVSIFHPERHWLVRLRSPLYPVYHNTPTHKPIRSACT